MTTATRTIPTFYPSILYRDAPAAIAWLSRAFGFVEHLVVPGPEGAVMHAELTFGDGAIMLGSIKDGGASPPHSEDAPSIYVFVEDVDGHYERALAAGAAVVRPIEDTDYGARMYVVRDLEGYAWCFGNYSVSW